MSYPYENLQLIANKIKEVQSLKADSLCGISGPEGVGKTACSYHLLTRVMADETDIDRIFNLHRNIAYTASEVDLKLKTVPIDTGLIIDEMGRIFYKRDGMTTVAKDGIKLFQQIRFRHLACFGNIPVLYDLDKDIRKRIWLWVHVYERGSAMVFIKDMNVFNADPWHTAENQAIVARHYSGPRDGQDALLSGYRETKNFIGEFKFPPMPPEVELEYEKISFERKLVKDVAPEARNKIALRWKERVRILAGEMVSGGYRFDGGKMEYESYTLEDIAKILNLASTGQISEIISGEEAKEATKI